MTTRTRFACLPALFVALSLSPPAPADEPADALVKKAWAITDAVLDNQVDPPARQQMLLGGLRALYRAANETPPADLGRRASAAATQEQFAALVRDLLPKVKEAEKVFLPGLVAASGRFVSASEHRALEQSATNRYVGTGIQIRVDPESKYPQIMIPFRGGPAHKGGAKPNDLILAVDGKSTEGEKLGDVVERIRGPEGSEVTFTVSQPNTDEKREIKMTRTVVPFEHVVGFRPAKKAPWEFRISGDEPIGYVRVKSLTSSIVHELREAERQLKEEGVRGVVLDLRFSFGFRMQHAALAADALLDGGLLWKTRDAAGRVREYKADRDCLLRDVPMVVLIDSTTAGEAVPLLAAAIQDNKRAVLVGEVSGFGGHVSGFVEVPGDNGILQTRTGLVERARAKPSEDADELGAPAAMGWRVYPDVRVGVSKQEMDAVMAWFQDQDVLEPKLADRPPEDRQLAKALEVLRGKMKAGAKSE
jgi:carboxyl-terminal processing protease